MAHIGVDLHQNSFTVCRLAADGSEAFETWQLCAADLDRFCLSLDADDEIAVEATGNSAWFREQVIACVGRVVRVNPRQFQVIRKSVKKTDRNDARALAFFLSKDMLPETRPRTHAESELASVTHTRDLLVKQRTRLLNKIHALYNRHGIKLKKESLSSKRRLMALDIGRFCGPLQAPRAPPVAGPGLRAVRRGEPLQPGDLCRQALASVFDAVEMGAVGREVVEDRAALP